MNSTTTDAVVGEEARGILIGPVAIAGVAMNAIYGTLDVHR